VGEVTSFSCIGSGPRMNGCSFFASSAIWQLKLNKLI